MHLIPAGLPSGIPGISEDIDTAMQQAPQPVRHSMDQSLVFKCKYIKILSVRMLYSVFSMRHAAGGISLP
jgi:hypothetical protein